MSEPIRTCEYVKALTDDEACNIIAEKAMQGIYSILPCRCDPPCRELTDEEKEYLQKKINDIIADKRKEKANEVELTMEHICQHISKYIKLKSGTDIKPEHIYLTLSAKFNNELFYFLEQYEEAVFFIGEDVFGKSALEYFEERLLLTMDNPDLKILAVRYQNAIAALEKKFKAGGLDESDNGQSSS